MKDALSLHEFEALATRGDLIPVWRTLPADTETPVGAFLKLPSQSHAFLLESVVGGERWGRHSFLGDRPFAVVRMQGKEITVEQEGRRSFFEAEQPIDALRGLLNEYRFVRPEGLPPFLGGLVGYFGYGAVRWFEPRVPQRHGADPDFPDGEWMLAGRLVAFDNLHHRLQIIACAHLPAHGSVKAAYEAAMEQVDALAHSLEEPLPHSPKMAELSNIEEGWGRPEFEAAVAKAREYIAKGDCMQVVLSRRVTATYEGDPFRLYRALRTISPTPYLYYLRFGERTLAAASPELLVRLQERKVTVRPIAGTRKRGKTPEEDLALEEELKRDEKERAEHVMLVDLGRNDVGRVSEVGSVRVDEREVIERYSHVMHLVSQVSGTLKEGLDGLDAIAASFPAGTLSGAPKVRAMEIIDELEPCARGPYGGAAGYLGFDGAMDLAITIRAVALAGKTLRFQAGAGVVHDSDPSREYEETQHKLRAALLAMGATR